MKRKLDHVRFERVPIIIKVTAPPNGIEQKIDYPKDNMIPYRYSKPYFVLNPFKYFQGKAFLNSK